MDNWSITFSLSTAIVWISDTTWYFLTKASFYRCFRRFLTGIFPMWHLSVLRFYRADLCLSCNDTSVRHIFPPTFVNFSVIRITIHSSQALSLYRFVITVVKSIQCKEILFLFLCTICFQHSSSVSIVSSPVQRCRTNSKSFCKQTCVNLLPFCPWYHTDPAVPNSRS